MRPSASSFYGAREGATRYPSTRCTIPIRDARTPGGQTLKHLPRDVVRDALQELIEDELTAVPEVAGPHQ